MKIESEFIGFWEFIDYVILENVYILVISLFFFNEELNYNMYLMLI